MRSGLLLISRTTRKMDRKGSNQKELKYSYFQVLSLFRAMITAILERAFEQ